jgi:hypothetical protein
MLPMAASICSLGSPPLLKSKSVNPQWYTSQFAHTQQLENDQRTDRPKVNSRLNRVEGERPIALIEFPIRPWSLSTALMGGFLEHPRYVSQSAHRQRGFK